VLSLRYCLCHYRCDSSHELGAHARLYPSVSHAPLCSSQSPGLGSCRVRNPDLPPSPAAWGRRTQSTHPLQGLLQQTILADLAGACSVRRRPHLSVICYRTSSSHIAGTGHRWRRFRCAMGMHERECIRHGDITCSRKMSPLPLQVGLTPIVHGHLPPSWLLRAAEQAW